MRIENVIQILTVQFARKYVNPLANSINKSLLESVGVVGRVKQDLRFVRASLESDLKSTQTFFELCFPRNVCACEPGQQKQDILDSFRSRIDDLHKAERVTMCPAKRPVLFSKIHWWINAQHRS